MRLLRYVALLSVLLLMPVAYSHAQISVGVGIGGPVYEGGYGYAAPVCSYGYYDYAPYACAPVGYYGPSWFNGGIFIGAGPWFRGGYGYGGYYPYGYTEGVSNYDYSSAPVYDDQGDAWSQDYATGAAPPPGGACGQWVWNASQQRYHWDDAGC